MPCQYQLKVHTNFTFIKSQFVRVMVILVIPPSSGQNNKCNFKTMYLHENLIFFEGIFFQIKKTNSLFMHCAKERRHTLTHISSSSNQMCDLSGFSVCL